MNQPSSKQQLVSILKNVGARVPIAAITLFFYFPLIAVVSFSFWERTGFWMEPALSFQSYIGLQSVADEMAESVVVGLFAGAVSVIIAFPVAYYATFKLPAFRRMVLLSILAVPFFVSPFVRTTMLIPIFGNSGIINDALLTVGVVDEPIDFIFSTSGIIIGAVITHTPVVIFTGWLSMSMIDKELIKAASDLRAKPRTVIRTIIVPLALPGLSVGGLFVIASTMGSTIYPIVLGGPSSTSMGLLVQRSFGQLNVPRAGAIMVVSSIIYLVGLYIAARGLDVEEMFERFE